MGDGGDMGDSGLLASSSNLLRVGVLAVQGDFAEHRYHLEAAADGCRPLQVVEVRKPKDLDNLQGLIIPGGESTTIGHFLQRGDFDHKLRSWISGESGAAPVVWGTCAGLILLSNQLYDQKQGGQYTIGGIDITACRNMYGRQQASFEAPLLLHKTELHEDDTRSHGVFIRAPGIKSVDSEKVTVLATLKRKDQTSIVAVEQDNLLVSSFHPELTDDLRWHRYFLRKLLKKN